MTDLDRVKFLLDYFGVVYTEEDYKQRHLLTIEAGAGPKNTGYAGFITSFEFDMENNFMEIGAWE